MPRVTICVYVNLYNFYKQKNGGMNMQLESTDKIQRVLGIYKKLVSGEIVNKVEEANNYGVNERSIQRDIDDIRSFMESEVGRTGIINNVIYDREKKGFRLEQQNPTELTNGQMLAICKILLDSRALLKTDMIEILNKLIIINPKPKTIDHFL